MFERPHMPPFAGAAEWLGSEPLGPTDGLIVIGVHTPEFSFEHEINRVRDAIDTRAICLSRRSLLFR